MSSVEKGKKQKDREHQEDILNPFPFRCYFLFAKTYANHTRGEEEEEEHDSLYLDSCLLIFYALIHSL